MRKIFLQLFVITFLLLSLAPAQAQDSDGKLPGSVTFKRLWVNYDTPFRGTYTDYRNATTGVEIGYLHPINEYFNIGIPLKVGIARFPVDTKIGSGNEQLFGSLDATLQFNVFGTDKIFWPYVVAGVGATLESEGVSKGTEMHVDIPIGVGLNIRLAENFYLNGQAEFRNSLTHLRNNSQIGVGFTWMFGDKEPPPPPDRDGDGIIDMEDDCPDTPGLASLKGCPDTDGDGIADKADDCPDTPGLAKFAGCPDTDEDGIKDGDDGCPEEAGPRDNNGCPILDADNDGIVDAEDKCPNEPGPKSNDGCPILDADGDGIVDADDKCPNEAGPKSNDGCPILDADKDGVPDAIDKCPATAGPASNQGCPEIKEEDKEVLKFAMESVRFNTGKATLKTESEAILNQVAEIMNKYPNYSLAISGHTDSVGNSASNQRLSENRANTCYNYLVARGISPTRMSHVGYGETQPIGDNLYKAGREQNRRVEFNIFLK